MTIETTTNRIAHSADGVQVSFPYDFIVQDSDDMFVYFLLDPFIGGFTVNGVGDPNGGDVVFDVPPPDEIDGVDNIVTLIRIVPLDQQTSYQPFDPFPAKTHEAALDKLTTVDQQQQEELDRAWKSVVADPNPPLIIIGPAEARANHVLSFNGDGTEIRAEFEIGNYKEEWQPNRRYSARDLVKAPGENSIWLIIEDHTSLPAWDPGSQPNIYTLILDVDGTLDASAVAQAAALAAVASADAAALSEASADADATSAAADAASAAVARTDSRNWSSEAEDVPVDDNINPVGFSSFHWAQKAENAVGGIFVEAGQGLLSQTGNSDIIVLPVVDQYVLINPPTDPVVESSISMPSPGVLEVDYSTTPPALIYATGVVQASFKAVTVGDIFQFKMAVNGVPVGAEVTAYSQGEARDFSISIPFTVDNVVNNTEFSLMVRNITAGRNIEITALVLQLATAPFGAFIESDPVFSQDHQIMFNRDANAAHPGTSITYDPTGTDLAAINVQDAITELALDEALGGGLAMALSDEVTAMGGTQRGSIRPGVNGTIREMNFNTFESIVGGDIVVSLFINNVAEAETLTLADGENFVSRNDFDAAFLVGDLIEARAVIDPAILNAIALKVVINAEG